MSDPTDDRDFSRKVKDALVQAKGLLETGGWIQRNFSDGNGAHCALGAINQVTIGEPSYFSVDPSDPRSMVVNGAKRFLASGTYTGCEVPGCACSVGNWNDHPSRTKEDVLAAFDRAVLKLEEEGA